MFVRRCFDFLFPVAFVVAVSFLTVSSILFAGTEDAQDCIGAEVVWVPTWFGEDRGMLDAPLMTDGVCEDNPEGNYTCAYDEDRKDYKDTVTLSDGGTFEASQSYQDCYMSSCR